jgi:hypothetical protein
MSRMESSYPQPALVSTLVCQFGERLLLVFSHPLFLLEFRDDFNPLLAYEVRPDFRRLYTVPGIDSACLFTTLKALCDMDKMLTPRRKKSDRLRASDLGYPEALPFLSRAERKTINSLTAQGGFPPGSGATTGVDVADLMGRGVDQGLRFLAWIKDTYRNRTHSHARTAADTYIRTANAIIAQLEDFRFKQGCPLNN